jgi:hypothetical protein
MAEVTGATRVLAMGGGGVSLKEAELSEDQDSFGRGQLHRLVGGVDHAKKRCFFVGFHGDLIKI